MPDKSSGKPLPEDWPDYVDQVLDKWHALLAENPEEVEVQRFLELHPSMVPGGSGDVGPGGHHGSEFSALFSQPTLQGAGRMFRPDFMWVTRSTSLITPILIEIEKPSKRWFQPNGRPTADFRDAHDQLNDWRTWFSLDENKALFRRNFVFDTDQYEHRPLLPQFVLIYGRQSEFDFSGGHRDPSALRSKRDFQRADGESFMTFDSLRPRYDHANSLTISMTARGPKVVAFSPTYGTSTNSGRLALRFYEIEAALERSQMMSKNRKDYLRKRFHHWRAVELEVRHGERNVFARGMGRE